MGGQLGTAMWSPIQTSDHRNLVRHYNTVHTDRETCHQIVFEGFLPGVFLGTALQSNATLVGHNDGFAGVSAIT